jgi:hypothetical protein
MVLRSTTDRCLVLPHPPLYASRRRTARPRAIGRARVAHPCQGLSRSRNRRRSDSIRNDRVVGDGTARAGPSGYRKKFFAPSPCKGGNGGNGRRACSNIPHRIRAAGRGHHCTAGCNTHNGTADRTAGTSIRLPRAPRAVQHSRLSEPPSALGCRPICGNRCQCCRCCGHTAENNDGSRWRGYNRRHGWIYSYRESAVAR